jgi:hypothetical protein
VRRRDLHAHLSLSRELIRRWFNAGGRRGMDFEGTWRRVVLQRYFRERQEGLEERVGKDAAGSSPVWCNCQPTAVRHCALGSGTSSERACLQQLGCQCDSGTYVTRTPSSSKWV